MLHTVLVLWTISTIDGREWEDACQSPSGLSSSTSSCSSYFYCSALTRSQVGECEEGKLWNKDLQICDLEQNVSCGKGLLWYLKAGLHLLVVAGRVTNKLMNHTSATQGSYPAKNEDMDQPGIKEIFGNPRLFNAVNNAKENKVKKGEEAIRKLLDTMTIKPQQAMKPSKDEEKSVSDDVKEDYDLADFVDKKVAISVFPEIRKPQAATPSQEEQGSGSLADYDGEYFDDAKNQNDLSEQVIVDIAELVNTNVGVLFQPEETTPRNMLLEALNQKFLQKTSKDLLLSEITDQEKPISELPVKLKLESKSSSSSQPSLPWIVSQWVPT